MAWSDVVNAALMSDLSVSLPADDWGTLSDSLEAEAVGLTPLEVQVSDSVNYWNDGIYIWNRLGLLDSVGGFYTASAGLPEESLGLYSDDLDVDLQSAGPTPLEANLPEDLLNNFADSTEGKLNYFFVDTDSLNVYVDALGIGYGFGFVDSLGAYSDDRSAFLTYSASLSVDSMSQSDEVAITLSSPYYEVSPSPSALNLWNDVVDATRNIFVDLSDSLASWADSVEKFQILLIPVELSDSLNNWADSVERFEVVPLTAELSDTLNNWADSVERYEVIPLTVGLSDDKDAFADSIEFAAGISVNLYDQWHFTLTPINVELFDYWFYSGVPLRISLADANEPYDDFVEESGGSIGRNLVDAKPAFADELGVTRGLRYSVKEFDTINWSYGNSDHAGFRIYRGLSSGNYTAYYQIDNPNTRSVSIRTAVPPGYWYIAVASYNADGIGPYSNELIVSYTELLDSITISTRSKAAHLADSRPAFSDVITGRFRYFASLVEPKDEFVDAVKVVSGIPVSLTDAKDPFLDSVSNVEGLKDSLPVPQDSIKVVLTQEAALSDVAPEMIDLIDTDVGQYVATDINVDLYEQDPNVWVDELIADAFDATALRVRFTESLDVPVDAFLSFMSLDFASDADDMNFLQDGFVWPTRYSLADTKNVHSDSVLAVLGIVVIEDLPGSNFDVAGTRWSSLSDRNTWEPVEYPDYTP